MSCGQGSRGNVLRTAFWVLLLQYTPVYLGRRREKTASAFRECLPTLIDGRVGEGAACAFTSGAGGNDEDTHLDAF